MAWIRILHGIHSILLFHSSGAQFEEQYGMAWSDFVICMTAWWLRSACAGPHVERYQVHEAIFVRSRVAYRWFSVAGGTSPMLSISEHMNFSEQRGACLNVLARCRHSRNPTDETGRTQFSCRTMLHQRFFPPLNSAPQKCGPACSAWSILEMF